MKNANMAEVGVGRYFKDKARKLRTRGATLIETAAVLAIVAILALGALQLITTVNQARLGSQAANELNTIQQAVRSLYGSQSNFAGISSEVLVSTKAVPQSMVSGTGLKHAFTGAITIEPAAAASGANSGFEVTFEGLPQDVCVKMLTADLGRGVYAAGVGTMVGQDAGLPLTPAAAALQCNSTYNNVAWVFY